MPTYRYTARDAQKHQVDGHIEAPSVEVARRQLEQQGLEVSEVIEAEAGPPEPPRPAPLAHEEAGQFVDNLAQLSAAGLPLPAGLRAAAEETENPRLAAALLYLADQLQQGRPLEEIVTSPDLPLPRYTSRLIDTAARTGRLGPALMELVEHDRVLDALRRDFWRGLAYPLCVAGLAVVILLFLSVVISGSFEKIYHDFQLKLPVMSQVFFAWRHAAPWAVPAVVLLVVLAVILLRWQLNPLARRRWLVSMPGIGPMWHWMGLLEWIGLLKALLRNDVPLFEALRLAADTVSDANIAQLSQAMAEGVARGRSLSHAMQSQRAVPPSLVPLVRWGEETGTLADSLYIGSEILQQRVRMRSRWLQMALPPLLFIAIGCGVLWIISSALLPFTNRGARLTG